MLERKILVVDDDSGIRDKLDKAFTAAGYYVWLADCAEEGIKIALQENIDVIFAGLKLAHMSGLEMCREIRRERPITIMVAVTDRPDVSVSSDCRRAGFDDCYAKSSHLDSFLWAADLAFEKIERWKKMVGAPLG